MYLLSPLIIFSERVVRLEAIVRYMYHITTALKIAPHEKHFSQLICFLQIKKFKNSQYNNPDVELSFLNLRRKLERRLL
jgi:hypothetical protein